MKTSLRLRKPTTAVKKISNKRDACIISLFLYKFSLRLWSKTVSSLCSIFTFPASTGHFVTNYRNTLSFLACLHILKSGTWEWNDVTDIIAVFCIKNPVDFKRHLFPFKLHTYKKFWIKKKYLLHTYIKWSSNWSFTDSLFLPHNLPSLTIWNSPDDIFGLVFSG